MDVPDFLLKAGGLAGTLLSVYLLWNKGKTEGMVSVASTRKLIAESESQWIANYNAVVKQVKECRERCDGYEIEIKILRTALFKHNLLTNDLEKEIREAVLADKQV